MDQGVIRAVVAFVQAEIDATECVCGWECEHDAFEDGVREGMIQIRDMIIQELLEEA